MFDLHKYLWSIDDEVRHFAETIFIVEETEFQEETMRMVPE